ncbi:MAG: hypothetical protein ACE5KM_06895 [Planctomycetaceae bacterium]
MRPLRLFAYLWASPASLLGLLFLPPTLLTGGRVRVVRGVLEITGGLTSWLFRRSLPGVGAASAMTLGHVIVGRNADCLVDTRDHEHVHVRQYERWGPLMLPIYLSASLVLWIRGRDPYFDNPFEREAYGAVDDEST